MKNLKVIPEFKWYKNGHFNIMKDECSRIVDTKPFRETYKNLLTFNHKINPLIAPRISPNMGIDRIFGYLKNIPEIQPLCVCVATLNIKRDLEQLKININNFKENCNNINIMVVNNGDMKDLNPDDIGCDSCLDMELENKNITYLKVLSNTDVKMYTNIVLCDDSFELEESTKEFFEMSKYKSMGFVKQNNKFNDCLYSVIRYDIPLYNKIMNDYIKDTSKFDFEEVLSVNLNLSYIMEI